MKTKNSAFTLVELLIAIAILTTVMGGIAFINITSQRYLKASSAFVTVSGDGRNTIERIVRPIRQANNIDVTNSGDRIEIRYDENEPPTSATSDDRNIAFYFDNGDGIDATINNNGIYFDSDNDEGTTNTLLVGRVMRIGSNNIFSRSGREVSITFKVQDDYPNDGYQAQDITTRVIMRN